MNIAKLLKIYMTEGGKREDTHTRGPTSLYGARQEMLYHKIPISPFDMQAIVTYALVSLRHSKESPQWKFEETNRILASGLDTIIKHEKTPLTSEPTSVANHAEPPSNDTEMPEDFRAIGGGVQELSGY